MRSNMRKYGMEFPREEWERLRRFSHVTGAPMSRIIRSMLEEGIRGALKDNAGWRATYERYEREDAERVGRGVAPLLRIVPK